MTDFKAKMHQIRFRLGLCPRPRWGSLRRSPRPPSWIWGALLLREGEGRKGEGWGWEGRGGEGRKGEGEGRGRKGPWASPLFGGSLRLWGVGQKRQLDSNAQLRGISVLRVTRNETSQRICYLREMRCWNGQRVVREADCQRFSVSVDRHTSS